MVSLSGATELTLRLSPEEIDSPYSYTGKRDVWYAGLILLQLLYGRNCLWIYPNLQTLLAHSELESSAVILTLSSWRRVTVHDGAADWPPEPVAQEAVYGRRCSGEASKSRRRDNSTTRSTDTP